MDGSFAPGQRVRVKRDCPLTLPGFAQMTQGVIVRLNEDGTAEVRFAANRSYPVPVDWVELVEGDEEE